MNDTVETADARDLLAEQAAAAMDAIDAPEATSNTGEAVDDFDAEAAAGLVNYGLSFAEMAIQGACDLPEFTFDAEKRDAFIKETKPLLDKYGMTWLGYFEQYKAEISFGLATLSLCGGSVMQVKRLQNEKTEKLAAIPQPTDINNNTDDNSIDLEAQIHADNATAH